MKRAETASLVSFAVICAGDAVIFSMEVAEKELHHKPHSEFLHGGYVDQVQP